MIPYMRRKQILEEFEKKEIVYLEDLLQTLPKASKSTIRRDLRILAEEGQIVLLHGGAAKLKTGSYDLPIQTKQLMNMDRKNRIARYAASLVNDGEVIYLDSGSTTSAMMKYLKQKEIVVVTSSIQVISELPGSKIRGIILGGDITSNLGSIVGPTTEAQLSSMFFDKAFLGTSGYSSLSGINTPDPREAKKKEIAKNNSQITYVLADGTKAGKTTLCKAFGIDECTIITDEPNAILEQYAKYIVAVDEAEEAPSV